MDMEMRVASKPVPNRRGLELRESTAVTVARFSKANRKKPRPFRPVHYFFWLFLFFNPSTKFMNATHPNSVAISG
jgi:hypothetical protein